MHASKTGRQDLCCDPGGPDTCHENRLQGPWLGTLQAVNRDIFRWDSTPSADSSQAKQDRPDAEDSAQACQEGDDPHGSARPVCLRPPWTACALQSRQPGPLTAPAECYRLPTRLPMARLLSSCPCSTKWLAG